MSYIAQDPPARASDAADDYRGARVATPSDTVLSPRHREGRQPDRVYRQGQPTVHPGAHVREDGHSGQHRPKDERDEDRHQAYRHVLDLQGDEGDSWFVEGDGQAGSEERGARLTRLCDLGSAATICLFCILHTQPSTRRGCFLNFLQRRWMADIKKERARGWGAGRGE